MDGQLVVQFYNTDCSLVGGWDDRVQLTILIAELYLLQTSPRSPPSFFFPPTQPPSQLS